jgi:hypothetical protein
MVHGVSISAEMPGKKKFMVVFKPKSSIEKVDYNPHINPGNLLHLRIKVLISQNYTIMTAFHVRTSAFKSCKGYTGTRQDFYTDCNSDSRPKGGIEKENCREKQRQRTSGPP